jgi:hypothetical protein
MEVRPSFEYPDSAGTHLANQSAYEVQISAYRAQGSLWTWTSNVEDWTSNLEDVSEFNPNERKVRGLECYQYASPTADPVVSQVELDESRLRNWLDSKIPLKNDQQPCAGYKILQFDANTSGDIPMKREDYVAINEAFGLPPVGLHRSTKKQGACGMFRQDDDTFGIYHVKMQSIRYYLANKLFSVCSKTAMASLLYDNSPPLQPLHKYYYGLHIHGCRL